MKPGYNLIGSNQKVLFQVINATPGNFDIMLLEELYPNVFVVDTTTTPDVHIQNTALPVADIDQQKQQLLDVLKTFKDIFANGGEPLSCTFVV